LRTSRLGWSGARSATTRSLCWPRACPSANPPEPSPPHGAAAAGSLDFWED
jgi:hypothetical protein